VQDALTDGAAGRRRIDRRALLTAVLVLVAGAVLGAIAFQFEQARATWRPNVTRTATGWIVRDAYGHGPSSLALTGDHIVWNSNLNVITMDLTSGRTKLLGVGVDEQSMWPPTVSDKYAVWLTATTGAGGAQILYVYTYEFASGRRVRLSGSAFDGIWSSPAISGATTVWAKNVGGGPAADVILGEDLATGRQFVVTTTAMSGSELGALGDPIIAGDLVAWSPVSADPSAHAQITVKDLATGNMRTIVPFAAAPDTQFDGWALSGDAVVWLQSALAKDASGATYLASTTMIAENVDTGVRRVVVSGRYLPTLPAWALDGDLLVWADQHATGPTTRVMGLRVSGGQPFVIETLEQTNVQTLLVIGDTVAMLLSGYTGNTQWIETVRVAK
jgi:hypothetical protein